MKIGCVVFSTFTCFDCLFCICSFNACLVTSLFIAGERTVMSLKLWFVRLNAFETGNDYKTFLSLGPPAVAS